MFSSSKGISNYGYRFVKRVILRRTPHTLTSWRFLFSTNNLSIRLHKRVFLRAWPRLPRPVYTVIACYSLLSWWCFWSWYSLARFYLKHANRIAREDHVAKWRQLLHLVRLAFARGVPSSFYYRYRLYTYPPEQWWDFIYDHELPHWHETLVDRPPSIKTAELIADKFAFAKHMMGLGIATVKLIALLGKGDRLKSELVLNCQNLFFKPRYGSRGDGCFALHYDQENDCYHLQRGTLNLQNQREIMDYIQEQITTSDYLVQPLLKNHPVIAEVFGCCPLATLRIVTAMGRSGCIVLSANIEIPNGFKGFQQEDRVACAYPVDLDSGGIGEAVSVFYSETDRHNDKIVGLVIPYWHDVIALCRQAHEQFPDLLTAGWDVAIKESGGVLLEGNRNWGTAIHQRIHAQPFLQGPLADVYQQKILENF